MQSDEDDVVIVELEPDVTLYTQRQQDSGKEAVGSAEPGRLAPTGIT